MDKRDRSRIKLYLQYLEELERIIDYKFNATEQDRIRYIENMARSDMDWVDIYMGGSTVGFLIVRKTGDDSFYIEEAYVKPSYRKHGIMTYEVRKYITKHPGKYTLRIYDKNEYAIEFWHGFFADEHFKLTKMTGLKEESTEYEYRKLPRATG